MAWYDEDSWATAAFAPKGSTILLTFLIAVLLPIFLHALVRAAWPQWRRQDSLSYSGAWFPFLRGVASLT